MANPNVFTWKKEDVANWVRSLDLQSGEAIAQQFVDEAIDGRCLLKLTMEELKDELGLNFGSRKLLFDAIGALRPATQEPPAAPEAPVTASPAAPPADGDGAACPCAPVCGVAEHDELGPLDAVLSVPDEPNWKSERVIASLRQYFQLDSDPLLRPRPAGATPPHSAIVTFPCKRGLDDALKQSGKCRLYKKGPAIIVELPAATPPAWHALGELQLYVSVHDFVPTWLVAAQKALSRYFQCPGITVEPLPLPLKPGLLQSGRSGNRVAVATFATSDALDRALARHSACCLWNGGPSVLCEKPGHLPKPEAQRRNNGCPYPKPALYTTDIETLRGSPDAELGCAVDARVAGPNVNTLRGFPAAEQAQLGAAPRHLYRPKGFY